MADGQVVVDRQLLDELTRRAMTIDGWTIRFGIPAPAEVHRGSKEGLTTANMLAFIEFGRDERKKKARKPRKKISKLRRRGRRLLGKIRRGRAMLGRFTGFGRKAAPKRKPKKKVDDVSKPRPVIRYVAAAKRGMMADGFKAAAKQALRGKDGLTNIALLATQLKDETKQRLVAVQGGVDTGQTLRAIDAVVIKARRSSGP